MTEQDRQRIKEISERLIPKKYSKYYNDADGKDISFLLSKIKELEEQVQSVKNTQYFEQSKKLLMRGEIE